MHDTENSKKTRKQLASENNKRFRTIVEVTNACLFSTDKRGRFTYLNDGALRALGYSEDELLGKFYLNYIYKHDKKSVHALFSHQLSTGLEAVNAEFRFVRKDGSLGWFMFLVNPINLEGKTIGLTGVALDITDRKRTESELIEEKDFTEKALNAQMDAFLVYEPDSGKAIRWNLAFRKMSGYSDEEISDMQIPDDWFDEASIKELKGIESSLKEGHHVSKELSFITKKGSRIPVEYSISPLLEKSGKLKYVILVGRDITERRIFEQRLSHSESHYRELFENMSDGVAIYEAKQNGRKFIFKNLNKAGQRISRININEIIGKDVEEVFPGVDSIGLLDVFKRVWKTGRPEFLPLTLYKDSRIVEWVENFVYKLPTGELVAIYKDVSEQKKAEDALRESERKYREVVENASDIIMTTDINGNYQIVNQAGLDASGYTLEELRKKNYLDLIPSDHKKQVQIHYFRQFVKKVHSTRLEYPFLAKSGEIRWLSQSATLIMDNNQAVGFHLVARDITERRMFEAALRESEELFRLSFENASVGMCLVDLDGYFLKANKQMSNIFGYTKEELAEFHVNNISHPEDKDISPNFIKRAASGEIEQMGFEKRYYHKDGHLIYGHVSSSLIKSTEGRPLYFISHVQDITLRHQAELEVEDSKKRLRELTAYIQRAREEERTVIARELHDELGQAMTVLKMDIAWLMKYLPQNHDLVNKKIEAMKSVIDSTMDTTRRLSAQLRPEILDDLGLAAAIEWQADELFNRTSIDYRIDEMIKNINVDPEISVAIFRIYQESINNIVKHAKATEVLINLKNEDESLILTVVDNGIGITEDNLSRRNAYGIIGMKERAGYFNGSVSIEGKAGVGTTIVVKIPLVS